MSLVLSLADVNKLEFKFELQSLNEIVEDKVAAMNDRLKVRELSVSMQNLPVIKVMGDRRRLSQIIENILENCYRYSNAAAEITISASTNNQVVKLAIEDNGPGVNQEVLPQLFERFYRADKSRSRQSGGSGLGLSLVKAFAEAQSGTADAYHFAQGGLGISISFPLPLSSR